VNINPYEYLCNRDKRNPIWESLYEFDENPPEPRKDCYCDNCFYGRDKLALEIIRLQKKNGE
jgi:hypothetical protein